MITRNMQYKIKGTAIKAEVIARKRTHKVICSRLYKKNYTSHTRAETKLIVKEENIENAKKENYTCSRAALRRGSN